MTIQEQINQDIYHDIREEVGRFVESHPNVSVRFEFSNRERRFLVSYHFESHPGDDDPVWDDVFEMEDYFYWKYHDDAPHFCEDNRLFALSPSAQTITPPKPTRPVSVRMPVTVSAAHAKTARI